MPRLYNTPLLWRGDGGEVNSDHYNYLFLIPYLTILQSYTSYSLFIRYIRNDRNATASTNGINDGLSRCGRNIHVTTNNMAMMAVTKK